MNNWTFGGCMNQMMEVRKQSLQYNHFTSSFLLIYSSLLIKKKNELINAIQLLFKPASRKHSIFPIILLAPASSLWLVQGEWPHFHINLGYTSLQFTQQSVTPKDMMQVLRLFLKHLTSSLPQYCSATEPARQPSPAALTGKGLKNGYHTKLPVNVSDIHPTIKSFMH